jgi:hypothetical protein
MKRSLQENIQRIQNIIDTTKKPVLNEQLVKAAEEIFQKLTQKAMSTSLKDDIIQILRRAGFGAVRNLEELKTAIAGKKLNAAQVEALMAIPNNTLRKNLYAEVVASLPKTAYQRLVAGDVEIVKEYLKKRGLSDAFVSEFEQAAKNPGYIPKQIKAGAINGATNSANNIVPKTGSKISPKDYPRILKGLASKDSWIYKITTYILKNPRKSLVGGLLGVPTLYAILDSFIAGITGDDTFINDYMDCLTDDAAAYLSTIQSIPAKWKAAWQKRKARTNAKTTQNIQTQQTSSDIVADIENKFPCVKGNLIKDNDGVLWVKYSDGKYYKVKYENNRLTYTNGADVC